MQAEGGFGRRQFFVGCFASVIEFGPQRLTNIKTTRPAFPLFVFWLRKKEITCGTSPQTIHNSSVIQTAAFTYAANKFDSPVFRAKLTELF